MVTPLKALLPRALLVTHGSAFGVSSMTYDVLECVPRMFYMCTGRSGAREGLAMRSVQLQQRLDGLLTTEEVAKRFNRSVMTISLWRRQRGLPAIEIPIGRRILTRFIGPDVAYWARRNNEMYRELRSQ